jgi:uncharacterized membrane protein
MSKSEHLWAVGFDDTGGAAQVRDEITRLAWEKHQLILLDVAVAVRYPDGCFTLNGEPFSPATKIHGGTLTHFLAGLALGSHFLTGLAGGATFTMIGARTEVGISDNFVREVGCLMQPGTSVLFVLDEVGDMDAILRAIRGLGGKVLKTNVDLEQVRLIQSTLAASAGTTQPNGQ